MKILVFQHGDFGEAWRRFQAGEPETYRDQKKSVEFVASFRDNHAVITVAVCGRAHEEALAENLWSIGVLQPTSASAAAMADLLDRLRPDAIICRSPNLNLLRWAWRNRVPTLPIFADIFSNDRLQKIRYNLALRATLLAPVFPCVANHSLNASLSVRRALFFPENRIIPWDWSVLPVQESPKPEVANADRPTAFFAGMLSASKGVGDCLDAVRLLKARGVALRFTFAGPGDLDAWRAEAAARGIAELADFPGRIPHAEVRARMRASDIVVVPSRHDYAEGLPNTIYEALASRSPLVMSDHPAFAGRLRPDEECLVFAAGNPAALADRMAKLVRENSLYACLSQRSAAAHDALYVGTEWTRLVATFLADPSNRTDWVAEHSLKRLRQEGRLGGARAREGIEGTPA